MKQRGWGVPLLLGAITFGLLAFALWPQEEPVRTIVVAARDLGAGAELQPSDLTVATVPETQAPVDAVTDPAQLVGQTLTVVRFAGEPVTARQLGDAVVLNPDERGIAVKVTADKGLAGLLRPGMEVGLIATLAEQDGEIYAKSMLEGLRVLYVPPDFQARPYAPISAQLTMNNGQAASYQAPPPTAESVEDGVLVLAASTQPMTVTYAFADPTVVELLPAEIVEGEEPAPEETEEPPAVRVVPIELLAALNAADAAFALVLTPESGAASTTEGLSVARLMVKADDDEDLTEVYP